METWKRLLKYIKYAVKHDNVDALIVVVGDVGMGKSTFAFRTGKECDEDNWSSDNVAPDTDMFLDLITKYGSKGLKGVPIMADETQWGAYSREAMTKSNREFNKVLMTTRGLNLIMIVLIPDFFSLDPYLRKNRVMFLVRVKADSPDDPDKAMAEGKPLIQRGKFEVYSRFRVRKIWKDKEKGYEHWGTPNFVDYFEEIHEEDDPEWKRYNEKKRAFMLAKGMNYGENRKEAKGEESNLGN